MAAPASRTRQANFSRSRICPSVDWSSVLTLAYPTTAMVRSMLKVWQAGLQPRSRPFPNYRWSDGIFKPCACLQPSGCELAQGLKIPLPGGSLVLDSPDRRTLPKNGGHWPFLRPGSSDLAALNRVSKPRIVGFRARIGGFSTRDEPLPPAQPVAVPSPANLPSTIEAVPSAFGRVRQALISRRTLRTLRAQAMADWNAATAAA